MSGAYSRSKGARGERELCRLFADYLGGEWCRNLKQYQQAQHGDIEQLVGGRYLCEVKNHATESIPAWWRQACDAAHKANAVPLLAVKVPRMGWKFILPMPEAQESGAAWAWDLRYTQTLYIEGLALHVRELEPVRYTLTDKGKAALAA